MTVPARRLIEAADVVVEVVWEAAAVHGEDPGDAVEDEAVPEVGVAQGDKSRGVEVMLHL